MKVCDPCRTKGRDEVAAFHIETKNAHGVRIWGFDYCLDHYKILLAIVNSHWNIPIPSGEGEKP